MLYIPCFQGGKTMSKRLVALLLLLVMAMSLVLTSCSSLDEDYEEETSTVKEITLSFHGIKGEGTTDAAVEAVEAKINEYTQKNYKTTIDLIFFDEDEYDAEMERVYEKLDAQRERDELAEEAASAAAKVAREAAKQLSLEDQKEKKRAQRAYEKWAEDNVVEDETSVEMEDDVVLDIFLMRGFDDYLAATEEEKLADLSSYANGTYKLIHKYTSPIVIQSAKRGGLLYGVPSNKLLATEDNEAYYYAVRTDLLEKYNIKIEEDEIPVLDAKFNGFFQEVKANESCEVILAPPTAIQNFDFYLDDMNKYPLYGTRSNEMYATTSTNLEFTYKVLDINVLDAGAASAHYKKMSNYRNLGYFAPDGATVENTDFALGVFHGTLADVKNQLGSKVDDYSYFTYKCARTTNDVVFENLLVVSADCKYPDRAFQIISALHTVPELRDLITYGIKDVNYMVNEDGKTIKKLNDEYNIGFETYGNSLIGYIPEELGADYQVESAKKNAEVKVSAYLGYSPELEDPDIDALEKVNEVGRKYQEMLMRGVENVDDTVNQAMIEMGKNENVLGVYPDSEEDEEDYSPAYQLVLEAINSDYSTYITNRPPDKQVPNNDFLSKEEQDRLDAIARAREEIIIKAAEALEEGQVIDRETGDITVEETGEFVKNAFEEAERLAAEAEQNESETPVEETPAEAETPVEETPAEVEAPVEAE